MPRHRRPTDRHRWTYRLRRRTLDAQLSFGFDPNGTPDRRRRAEELTGEEFRQELARRLEHLVSEAFGSPHWQSPVRWADVRDVSTQLSLLAETLAGTTEVSPQGVARASLLLGDGDSPLYGPEREDLLETAVGSALASLELGPMLEPIRDWTEPPPIIPRRSIRVGPSHA